MNSHPQSYRDVFRNKKHCIPLLGLILLFFVGDGISQKTSYSNSTYEKNSLKKVKTVVYSETGYSIRVLDKKKRSASVNTVQTRSAREIADSYIRNNSQLAALHKADFRFEVTSEKICPGGTHIIYQSFCRGIPVYNSEVVISLNKDNVITFVSRKIRSGTPVYDIQPGISGTEAIKLAREYLNVGGKLHAAQSAELTIFDSNNRGLVLTYRVEIPVTRPRGDWELFVDAQTGEIIHVSNRMMFDHTADGTGAVWDTDPLSMAAVYYGNEFIDNNDQDNDVLNDQRVFVTLNDITYADSVLGYVLAGPYVRLADRDPDGPVDIFPVESHPDSFIYRRSQQEFEDVMVYYHLDKSYRRLQTLGFEIDGLAEFQVDPHGLNGEDNSYYSPLGNFCAFGEGGVDDAEDGAVLWHEYAHAIQENIVHMVAFGETFSLKEGSSDYWAVSYKKRQNLFGWENVFLWDPGITDGGGYEFWAGRRCDLDWKYPEDYQLYEGTYEGGQIWSSALMHIWNDLGPFITDQLFIAAHYYWGSDPGLQGAALAFLQADMDINDAENFTVISDWFAYHGLINPDNYRPGIVHTQLKDTEDLIGPYPVICQIFSGISGLDSTNLWLYWTTDSVFSDSTLFIATGRDHEYTADIYGTAKPDSFRYYIYALDSIGQSSAAPKSAPIEYFAFYAGPDTVAPIIHHTPLSDISWHSWPHSIFAQVSDNISVDSVWVEYQINKKGSHYSFVLNQTDTADFYFGQFYSDSGEVQPRDTIFYSISATDSSTNSNLIRVPYLGYYDFIIYQLPPTPSNLQVLRNQSIIELGWDPVQLAETLYYRIYKRINSGSFALLDSTSISTYIDSSAILGDTCYYYLTSKTGQWESEASDTIFAVVEAVVGIEKAPVMPMVFSLEQNYPNPFNPQTKIRYQLAKSAPVKLEIYNILGQKIKTLVDQYQDRDFYQVIWDGRTDSGSDVAAGVYIYHLKAGNFVQTRKMLLIK